MHEVAARRGRLPGYHDHRTPFLEVHVGGPLQQVLAEALCDAGTRRGAGGDDDHASHRVRAAGRTCGEVTGRPVFDVGVGDVAAQPGGEVVLPVRVTERAPGLVEMVSRAARDTTRSTGSSASRRPVNTARA